jgi:hypothetical protein
MAAEERKTTDHEKTFVKHIPDKGLIFKIYKEPSKLNRKTNSQVKKWKKEYNKHHTKKDIQ